MEKSEATGILNTKTHRRLRKAYSHLINKIGEDKITVSALTEEADVSRATFYTYFQNIEEFRSYALEYILTLFVKQISIFLEGTKEDAREKTRKRNLIFTEDDFELFICLFKDNQGFGFSEDVYRFIYKCFAKEKSKFFSSRYMKKHKTKLDLFYIGYAGAMRVNFLDYHSDKVYRDIIRTVHIWDYMFTDYSYND